MYIVRIQSEDLIDALEEKFGDVYEHIKEGDTVIEVRRPYGGWIEITIGNREET